MAGFKQPLDSVVKDLDSIKADDFATDGDRNKALLAAYALVSRLETPWETVSRLCMSQVNVHTLDSFAQLNNNTSANSSRKFEDPYHWR